MQGYELVNLLADRGFSLHVEGDRLAVSPASRLTDDIRKAIRAHKAELLELLRRDTWERVTLVWPAHQQGVVTIGGQWQRLPSGEVEATYTREQLKFVNRVMGRMTTTRKPAPTCGAG